MPDPVSTVAAEPKHCPCGSGKSWKRCCAERASRAMADRNEAIRAFNRLEVAISHHKKGKAGNFEDDTDEALYAARDRVLKSLADRDGTDPTRGEEG